MKYLMILLVVVGMTIPFAFANDYAELVVDGHVIIVNSDDVADISLDWDSEYLPEFSVNFTEPYTGQFQIQIPKNIPRTMNLDFETTLMMDVSSLSGAEQEKNWNDHITEKDFKMIDNRISETESLCYYVIAVELSEIDYFKIVTGSVASGRWEPVTIENEECNDKYGGIIQNGSIFPRHGYQPSHTMSPLKQLKSGVALADVQCSDEKHVIYKHDRMRAACVTSSTYGDLIERGWAALRLESNATSDVGQNLCKWYGGDWDKWHRHCNALESSLLCTMAGGNILNDDCFIPKTELSK